MSVEQAAATSSVPPQDSMLGNLVCGAALLGTAGGAINFLLDFPEPCRVAMTTAEQHDAVKQVLGDKFRRQVESKTRRLHIFLSLYGRFTHLCAQMWWEGHVTKDTAQIRIKLDGSLTSAILVGNIVCVSPAPGAEPLWQPLLLELHHYDQKGQLHMYNLLPGAQRYPSVSPP